MLDCLLTGGKIGTEPPPSIRAGCASGMEGGIVLQVPDGLSLLLYSPARDQAAQPDSLLKRSIRSALKRAGIVGKQIGWHNFRHSLATNLRAMGVDIEVAQELLRHANSRTTLDVYTRAVSQQKRDASAQVVEMLLPTRREKPSAPVSTYKSSQGERRPCAKSLIMRGLFGGPDRDRTDDLFHAITTNACNLLILVASVATKSILEHPRTPSPAPLRSQKKRFSESDFLAKLSAPCGENANCESQHPRQHPRSSWLQSALTSAQRWSVTQNSFVQAD
jgi:hypothetical protein